MKNNRTHIISSVGWQSSFDSKADAFTLQNKISAWSKLQMPREISRVFDQICPDDQTWKINRLEIDLGVIEYRGLESVLTSKLALHLKEALLNAALYTGSNKNSEIEIIESSSAAIELILSFLLHGHMPWNYDGSRGSVDELLQSQLVSNRKNMIAVIKEIGKSDENVRKRIAWQVSDPVIRELIVGLEPGNHKDIFNFTEQITDLQQKENIVKTSLNDFKNRLWLWVLNYLLKERGSVFNRQAFIKSNIRQMAAAHNISYEDLLILINRAVELAGKKTNIKDDFIKTLKLISDESALEKSAGIRQDTDYWPVLKEMFTQHSRKKNGADKQLFNELVSGLYRDDRSRFNVLLSSFRQKDPVWAHAVRDLKNTSIEVLFESLNRNRSAELVQTVYFLHKNLLSQNVSVNSLLWESGLKFIRTRKDGNFTKEEFINDCISRISEVKNIAPEKLHSLMTFTELPQDLRTKMNIDTYECFRNISGEKTAAFHHDELMMLLDRYRNFSPARLTDKVKASLSKDLYRHLRFNTGLFVQALIRYSDKTFLNKTVLPLLNFTSIKAMLENSGHSAGSLILSFNEAIQTMSASSTVSLPLSEDSILRFGLSMLLSSPDLSKEKTIARLLKEFSVHYSGDQWNDTFTTKFFSSVTREYDFSEMAKHAVTKINSRRFNARAILRLISLSANSQQLLSSYLQRHFADEGFRVIREENSEAATAIIEYMLKDGTALMNKLIRHYNIVLKKDASLSLREMYWQVLLSLQPYNRTGQHVQAGFMLGFVAKFPGTSSRLIKKISADESALIMPHQALSLEGVTIKKDELFILIEKSLAAGTDHILYRGRKIKTASLIAEAAILDSGRLRTVMNKTKNLHRSIWNNIPFDEFSTRIMSDLQNVQAELMNELRIFYTFTEKFFPELLDTRLKKYFIALMVQLTREKKLSESGIRRFATLTLNRAVLQSSVKAREIAEYLKEAGLRNDSFIFNIIQQQITGPVITVQQNTATTSIIEDIERKGMLNDLISYLLVNMESPFRLAGDSSTGEELFREIILHYPENVLIIMKKQQIGIDRITWISSSITFTELLGSLSRMEKGRQVQFDMLKEFYSFLGKKIIKGISGKELQAILFRKVTGAWLNNNWKTVSADMILNELAWELSMRYGIIKKDFSEGFSNSQVMLPPSLRIVSGFGPAQKEQPSGIGIKEKETNQLKKMMSKKPITPGPSQQTGEMIPVKNAGIVLLNMYVPILFERLGFIANNQFINEDYQTDAVHYLQYIVTGLTQTEESFLPLNKLLCGLPLSAAVKSGIDIPEKDIEMIDSLIRAAIGYWPAIGDNSVRGFRGNWLVRDGLLSEASDKWQLTVDKRAYDLLISKSPFSFSIIKYPWMKKPLHVTWPF